MTHRKVDPRAHLRSGSDRYPGVLATAGDWRIARGNGGRVYLVQSRQGDEWATISTAPTAGYLGRELAISYAPPELAEVVGALPDDPRSLSAPDVVRLERSLRATLAARARWRARTTSA